MRYTRLDLCTYTEGRSRERESGGGRLGDGYVHCLEGERDEARFRRSVDTRGDQGRERGRGREGEGEPQA